MLDLSSDTESNFGSDIESVDDGLNSSMGSLGSTGIPGESVQTEKPSNVVVVKSLASYDGNSLKEKTNNFIGEHGVVVISKSWCPFCIDVTEFLAERINVQVHVLEVNKGRDGPKILKIIQEMTGHPTVPVVYMKGTFIGGCDTVKALHERGKLEKRLTDLVKEDGTKGTENIETSDLKVAYRSKARNPLLCFPNIVNNRVVRLTGFQCFVLSALSCVFYKQEWAHYLTIFLAVDYALRFTVGSSLSPLGMIATAVSSPFEPNFRPGIAKQFAACCGLFFSTMAASSYFSNYDHHELVGAIWVGILACATGMEAFMDFCLGCTFFGFGIQFGVLPNDCYRIYTQTRQETVDTYHYKMKNADAPEPYPIDTNALSPISLKYKSKTSEWTKDDFHLIRNMQVSYFAMPLSLACLSVAMKLATSWTHEGLVQQEEEIRDVVISMRYSDITTMLAVVIFVVFVSLYCTRFVLYSRKCWKEWDCPHRSSYFGTITTTILLLSFLVQNIFSDKLNDNGDGSSQVIARVLFWIGATGHSLLTIACMGEWIGRRLEMEHVHPHWMFMPTGLSVAAFVLTVVEPFGSFDNANTQSIALAARFFNSFGQLLGAILFGVSFWKVVTTHNSNNALRHGIWLWLATPCAVGLSNFAICTTEYGETNALQCSNDLADLYFIGVFISLSFAWSSLPHLKFLSQDNFNMGYWIGCFALDTLAACSCLFYSMNGYRISEIMQWVCLMAATICNFCAFLHTGIGVFSQRGVFTPEVKWGPLSFMQLTHAAFRSNMSTLKYYMKKVNFNDHSVTSERHLKLFAAHFNRFRLLHEEHSKHEDEVIFKTFNDFFPKHARKYCKDHERDHLKFEKWVDLANTCLDVTQIHEDRKEAFLELKKEVLPFLRHFNRHLDGEEEHLNPVGRKFIPLSLAKQLAREVWRITPAGRWEVMIPFVINNLPRHMQRVRYIKVLLWSMPERAQQIGAIIYRNVDAVMWERLRVEVPEMIPRGAEGWRRYY